MLDILITRPNGVQIPYFIEQFYHAGYRPHHVPMLRIEPLTKDEEIGATHEVMKNLEYYNKIIFISPNAARIGLNWIAGYREAIPEHLSIYAIGQSTKRTLINMGVDKNRIITPKIMSSAGLLAMPDFENISLQQIALIRGEYGLNDIQNYLERAGAQVKLCNLYRSIVHPEAQDILTQLKQQVNIDIITCMSVRTALSLAEALRKIVPEWIDLPLIVASDRIAKQAKILGFSQIFISQQPTIQSFIEQIGKCRNT